MKYYLTVLLCLLLCGCDLAYIEPTTNAVYETSATPTEITTTTEPPTTLPTEPPHADFYDPNIAVEDLITWFSEVNFDAEIVNSGNPGVIQKWEQPIYYYIISVE